MVLIFGMIITFTNIIFPQYPNWGIYSSSNSTMINSNITCITGDSKGNIYCGSQGSGLYKLYFKSENLNFGAVFTIYNSITINNPPPSDLINDVIVDKNDNVYIATDSGFAKLTDTGFVNYNKANSKLPSNSVKRLALDSNNNVWLLCNFIENKDEKVLTLVKFDGDSIKVVKSDSSLESMVTRSFAITIDNKNNIYFTGWRKELWVYNIDNNIFYTLCDTLKFPNNPFNEYVKSWPSEYMNLYWKDDILWSCIGTTEMSDPNRIIKYDLKNNKYIKYDLNNLKILWGRSCIAFDSKNNLWIGAAKNFGSNGFSEFNSNDPLNCLTYSTDDYNTYNVWEIYCDKLDNKWIACAKGIGIYNENGIFVTDIKHNFAINNLEMSINPNPATDNITISFTNTDFSSPSISIYNSLGIELKRYDNTELIGKSSINLTTDDFPSGIYYCTLNSGINKITKSFVVIR